MENVKRITIFLISFAISFLLLFSVNNIPQSFISENIYSSMNKMNTYTEKNYIKGLTQTKTDNLDDLYIMETIFYSSNDALKNVLLPEYNEIRNEDTYLSDTLNQMNINNGLDKYIYFTGSNIILKPLFMCFSLSQIKMINLFLLILLIIIFIILCEKNKLRNLWFSFIIGFLMTYSFLTPTSLNYMPSLLIALLLSVIILLSKKQLTNIFIIIGVLTIFFDNFTTGSLIFVIPFITNITKNFNFTEYKEFTKKFLKNIAQWIISAIFTIVIKFILTYFLYKEILIDEIIAKIQTKPSVIKNISYTLYQNITKVFPLKSTNAYNANVIIILIMVFVFMVFLYTYKDKNKNINKIKILSYLTISIVPIIYLIMCYINSYSYSFITYRNLLGSIMCIVLIAIEITEFKKIKNSGDSTVN